MQAKLIRQPKITYPEMAKQARVSGTVSLMAIIAKDGTMKRLELIEGDPMLVMAAMEGVKQWVYQPTLLNGEPVEVQTTIDVNFTLQDDNGAPAKPAGGEIRPAQLVRRYDPDYPKLARETGAKGPVTVQATIAADGTVVDAKAIAGHPMLRKAAENCVRKWIYTPALLNGQPVETQTNITITFVGDFADPAPPQAVRQIASVTPGGGTIQVAQLIRRRDPEYPQAAREAGVKGRVIIIATIDKDGRVKSAVAQDGPPELRTAAEEAVRQWQYKPALLNGEPVETQTNITLTFVGGR